MTPTQVMLWALAILALTGAVALGIAIIAALIEAFAKALRRDGEE